MANPATQRFFTLVHRELQEYRVSLLWTPLAVAGLLAVVMLFSVVVADRISANGQPILDILMQENLAQGMKITIHMDDESGVTTDRHYEMETAEGEDASGEWDFSRDWEFKPTPRDRGEFESEEVAGTLNPILNIVHMVMLLVLFVVTVNYLLGCLYDDRKDRSILFWKSMPVSEWEEVLSRLAVALLVAPAIFIGISLLLQVVFILAAMLMIWRSEMDPFDVVLSNVQWGRLLLDQFGSWALTALWIAPVYAWLMLASAAARRSPFLLALTPVIGLIVLESILLGSNHFANAVEKHLPRDVGGEHSLVNLVFSSAAASPDWLGMLLGLLFAAGAIAGAVYLRRYRFEI